MKLAFTLCFFSLLAASGFGFQAGKTPEKVLLQSSEIIFSNLRGQLATLEDVAVSPSGEEMYLLTKGAGLLRIRGKEAPRRIAPIPPMTGSLAVGAQGEIYLADIENNEVVTLNHQGQKVSSFSVPRPDSISVLRDGSVVVASADADRLLHVYDKNGNLLMSFAKPRKFSDMSEAQSRFLNRGKVLVDAADNIYFVPLFDPEPVARIFSPRGERILEFSISGQAVNLQIKVAENFLRNRTEDQIGGIHIIRTAEIDRLTNHLWIGLNGSSNAAVVYEYNDHGQKLREFQLAAGSDKASAKPILAALQLTVRYPEITVFSTAGARRFDLREPRAPELLPMASASCPAAQEWSPPADSKAALEMSLDLDHQRIVSASFGAISLKSSAKYSFASVELCDPATNHRTYHSTAIEK